MFRGNIGIVSDIGPETLPVRKFARPLIRARQTYPVEKSDTGRFEGRQTTSGVLGDLVRTLLAESLFGGRDSESS